MSESAASRRRSQSPRSSAAFTLVELLVAMMIISILAALLLGVAARAGETAREARTKQLIARIHTLLMERYESYRNRRVESLNTDKSTDYRGHLQTNAGILSVAELSGATDPRVQAMIRLAAARELMKLEMPDRWSDLALSGNAADPIPASGGPNREILQVAQSDLPATLFLEGRPSLNQLYIRRYNEVAAGGVELATLLEHQGAECLYMVVMNATGDGESRGLFNEGDVGDVDGDGAPEFLDGWGNPISWLRWAPGFSSDTQLSYVRLKRIYDTNPVANSASLERVGQEGVRRALTEDHDPLDLFRVDRTPDDSIATAFDDSQWANNRGTPARGWRLLPLVFSAGADEEYGLVGLRIEDNDGVDDYVAAANPWPDDVDATTTSEDEHFGQPDPNNDEDYVDNVHNHLITAR